MHAPMPDSMHVHAFVFAFFPALAMDRAQGTGYAPGWNCSRGLRLKRMPLVAAVIHWQCVRAYSIGMPETGDLET
jgi:hypothetical protein